MALFYVLPVHEEAEFNLKRVIRTDGKSSSSNRVAS